MSKESSNKLGWNWIVLSILSSLVLILGYISFDQAYPGYAFTRKFYYTIQLFVLESGDNFYETPTGYSQFALICFNTARYLAVFLLVYTIITAVFAVVRDNLFMKQMRRMKGHTILCGLGELGTALARDLPNKKNLVIIEKTTDNEYLTKYRQQGVKILEGNALDPEVLRKVGVERAAYLYALTGDDFGNLTIIKQVNSIMENANHGHPPIRMAANIDSLNLKTAANQEMLYLTGDRPSYIRQLLESYKISAQQQPVNTDEYQKCKAELLDYDPEYSSDGLEQRTRIKLFNINEIAARFVFRYYPPDRFKPVTKPDAPALHILLIGYSQMGEEFFKLLVQNCHYINKKNTRITLLNSEADMVRDAIFTAHRELVKLIDIEFIKLNPHNLTHGFISRNNLNEVDVIYVCSDQDRFQASYSLKAREVFNKEIPIVRWYSKDIVTGASSKDTVNIFTIEILKTVATSSNIMDESIDQKAVATHNRWLKRAVRQYIDQVEGWMSMGQEIQPPKATMLPWHLLDEEIRDDNKSVVEHTYIKLRTVNQLNFDHNDIHPTKTPFDFSFLEDEAIVMQLAEMEHRRWMATRFYYAWELDPVRNDTIKHHNDLVDFDELSEATKDYDIKLIRELPEVWKL